ncbi:segregation/condensation protein A [Streptomyces jietaisiensis]|uniref:segregation/condensation protein A n=1 Tax=Streptomyces griseoaurantiacus TaxID=68213 RepID=UPI00324B3328
MTAYDTPRGRRRPLGRGPRSTPDAPPPATPEAPSPEPAAGAAADALETPRPPEGPQTDRGQVPGDPRPDPAEAPGPGPRVPAESPSPGPQAAGAAADALEAPRPPEGPQTDRGPVPGGPRPDPAEAPGPGARVPAEAPSLDPQAAAVGATVPAVGGSSSRVDPHADSGTVPEAPRRGPDGQRPSGADAAGAPTPESAAPRQGGAPGGGSAGPGVAEVPAGVRAPESEERSAGEPDAAGDGVFTVRLVNFEGPFDLLLQLISRHKLDVTEVALSKVTDEFMAHIRGMGSDWDLDRTTEFLVVAATLLDLKAARLLPTAEVEDEADLALLEARDLLFARLLQYRAYKQIAGILHERAEAEVRRYPRTVGLEPHHAELLPDVVISIGPEGFARLAVKAMQPKPRPQVYVDHIHAPLVSVREQAGIVVARLRELGEASFRVLVEDTEDTLTVVARFLALLELYREKAVALDQESALGELLVRWTGGEDGSLPAVTDEFDRPPERRQQDGDGPGERQDRTSEEEKA